MPVSRVEPLFQAALFFAIGLLLNPLLAGERMAIVR
jgi:hypothetical protein